MSLEKVGRRLRYRGLGADEEFLTVIGEFIAYNSWDEL